MSTLLITGPALCCWRENRSGGRVGMQSVLNVLANRAKRDNTSMYAEAVRKLQFSSMTARGDSQTVLWPIEGDPLYAIAEEMVQNPELPDITNGSVDYYAPQGLTEAQDYKLPNGSTVKFPATWNPSRYIFETEIAGQLFWKETQ